jgi:simple sugar transport system ATP-binding protein
LARLMVGRDVPSVELVECGTVGDVLLDLQNLEVAGDLIGESDILALRGLSLEVRAGQILGLAGVSGNGQRELAEAAAGLRHVRNGRIRVCGRDVTNRPPGEIINAGFSLIPEDRMGVGLIPTLSVEANAILKSYRLPPIARGPLLDLAAARRYAEGLVKEFSVQVARMGDPVGKLSGGNLQRLLLAREMLARPRVMIAVHPTRGLDVQATADVHRLLLQQRADGGAILLISEDLDEILALSDCVAVIHEGRIMGRFARGEVDIAEIGLLMAGHVGEVHA